jgi:RND family efflux transporter MFP subunit
MSKLSRIGFYGVLLGIAGLATGSYVGFPKIAETLGVSELLGKATSLVQGTTTNTAAGAKSVGSGGTSTPGQNPAAPPPGVTVSQPLERTIVEWDDYTGRFDAVDTVDIRARVSGYLTEIHFKDGQRVKKGDLLYTIDPRPFQRALEQTQAELAQAKTKVENSTLDVDRGRPLLDRKIMSEKVFDDRANTMRDAQAQVKVADAKVKTAELDLMFTSITSPITGRISRSAFSIGSWISAGAAANSSLLTTIVSEDPIHIYFDVSENNWIKYRRLAEKGLKAGAAQLGAKVEIALPDEKGFPHTGVVDFVDNRLDQSTGTLRGRALVNNKTGLFSAGMFARVRVSGSEDYKAVMLPDEAVATDQTNKFVLVVTEDGTVTRRTVVLGPMIDDLRVVRDGISGGDWVITKGLQRARPGGKVTAKREAIKVSETIPAKAAPPPAGAPSVALPITATAPAAPTKQPSTKQ